MSTTFAQLSALSRLFSPTVFREFAAKGRSRLFARLVCQTGVLNRPFANDTVGQTFDAAFRALQRAGCRSEYVFRAALTQNVLLGRHSLNSASMLTEFRAGSSKADVVILNGTSTVYEIKSDRDSLTRLTSQLANYSKVFACIYVIAAEKYIAHVVRDTSQNIGVMSLTHRNQLHIVRDAQCRPHLLCATTIFDSLRLSEAREILDDLGVETPNVSSRLMRTAMRECFAHLDPVVVHDATVKALRRGRTLAPLAEYLKELPSSTHAAALTLGLRKPDYRRLIDAVKLPLRDTLIAS